MPPRPRKTAAKPAAPAAVVTETGPAEPNADGQAQAEAAANRRADPAAPSPGPEPEIEPVDPGVDSDEYGPAGAEPEPTAPASHWETATGTLGDPCRLCLPGGPPEAAGSIGCQHGQWVRVWDGDQ